MGSLTIRIIDDALKERLRVRAARQGHPMEEEVRVILKQAVDGVRGETLLALSRRLFKGAQGVEIDLPARRRDRAPPSFNTPGSKPAPKRK